jgi:hypothetical protein
MSDQPTPEAVEVVLNYTDVMSDLAADPHAITEACCRMEAYAGENGANSFVALRILAAEVRRSRIENDHNWQAIEFAEEMKTELSAAKARIAELEAAAARQEKERIAKLRKW